jgi:hypothetical protein
MRREIAGNLSVDDEMNAMFGLKIQTQENYLFCYKYFNEPFCAWGKKDDDDDDVRRYCIF